MKVRTLRRKLRAEDCRDGVMSCYLLHLYGKHLRAEART